MSDTERFDLMVRHGLHVQEIRPHREDGAPEYEVRKPGLARPLTCDQDPRAAVDSAALILDAPEPEGALSSSSNDEVEPDATE